MTESVYDFVCSIGELIDKLSIENIKCYDANNKILAIRRLPEVDVERIASLEAAARSSGEQRVRLRDEINRRLAEAVARGGFQVSADVRTYELVMPRGRVACPPPPDCVKGCPACLGRGYLMVGGASNPVEKTCGNCKGVGIVKTNPKPEDEAHG